MQNPFLNLHEPLSHPESSNEEQFAQRYGRLAHFPTPWERASLKLGKLLLKLGQQLTHEDPCGELTREAA